MVVARRGPGDWLCQVGRFEGIHHDYMCKHVANRMARRYKPCDGSLCALQAVSITLQPHSRDLTLSSKDRCRRICFPRPQPGRLQPCSLPHEVLFTSNMCVAPASIIQRYQSQHAAASALSTKYPNWDGRRLIDSSGLRVHPTTTSGHQTRPPQADLTGRS
jgi:hypothetical protein